MSQFTHSFARVGTANAHACCPACRYARIGLSIDARCPECGAAGIDRSLVAIGCSRTGRLAYVVLMLGALISAALLVGALIAEASGTPFGLGIAAYTRHFERVPLFLKLAIIATLVMLVDQVWKRVTNAPIDLDSPVPLGGIAWVVHPSGIEVREPGHARWIPRESIAGIRARRTLLGRYTSLEVVFKTNSIRGILSRTTILYMRGSEGDCSAAHAELAETLELAVDQGARSLAA